jgi:Tfp pilus assembly protein PilF
MPDTLKRALALFQKGAHRESDELYKTFLEHHPMDSGAWHMRGYVAVQLNELDNAIRYISRAIELKPNVYSMHVNLGSALAAHGQFKKAIAPAPMHILPSATVSRP